jgi:hypothetical protein
MTTCHWNDDESGIDCFTLGGLQNLASRYLHWQSFFVKPSATATVALLSLTTLDGVTQ